MEPEDDELLPATQQGRAKAYEALLRANPPTMRVIESPTPEHVPSRAKVREFLFRGGVYTFEAIGPRNEAERRAGIVQRWQADIHADQDIGINVVVHEYRDGRFTPWTFDGIFFNDFLQAATVGVVSGGFQAQWHNEQQKHERSRRTFALLLPGAALLGFMAGVLLVLR